MMSTQPPHAVGSICRMLLGFALGMTALRGAEGVEFVGLATTPARASFVLKDVSSGAVSQWLGVGQTFRGHKIEAYDASQETLTLSTTDGRLTLRLVGSKVWTGLGKYPYDADPDLLPDRRVTIVGAVAEEGSIKPHEGTTLESAIAAMGGFKANARITAIRLARPVTRIENGEKRSSVLLQFLDFSTAEARATRILPGDIVNVPSADDPRP